MAEITNEQQQTAPDDDIAQEQVINVKGEDTANDTTKEEGETNEKEKDHQASPASCLLYTSPSPRDATLYRMPSYA